MERIEFIKIKIGEIQGVHDAITELEDELTIPPYGMPSSKDLSKDVLKSLLEHFPIRVVSSRGYYRCVGNVRLFRIAFSIFDIDEVVTVQVIRSRMKASFIQDGYLTELFYFPALFGISADDAERLFQTWKHLEKASEKPRRTYWPSKSAFARVLRVSIARLKDL